MSGRPDISAMAPDAAAAFSRARATNLYRRANKIHALAQIARECTAPGRSHDLDRAERLLGEIAALGGGSKEA